MAKAPTTHWRCIAPVLPVYLDLEHCLSQPFDFGRGVTLGPAGLGPIPEHAAKGLSEEDREDLDSRRSTFVVEYVDGHQIDHAWKSRTSTTNRETAQNRIHYATIALWLTRITPLGVRLAFHQVQHPDGHFMGASRAIWEPIRCAESQSEEHLQPGDLERAKLRFENLYALGARGSVATTVRLLLKALSDSEAVSAFALLWTCVEALFGPEAPGETTHQLAERVALFLHGHSDEAFDDYRQFKDDYALRSRIIHGHRTKRGDEERFPAVFERTIGWVRFPLQRIADDPVLAATFNGNKREDYLRRLPFTAAP